MSKNYISARFFCIIVQKKKIVTELFEELGERKKKKAFYIIIIIYVSSRLPIIVSGMIIQGLRTILSHYDRILFITVM